MIWLLVKSAVFLIVAVYIGIAGLLYFSQRSLLYYPDARRPDLKAVGLGHAREIELATADNMKLLAWYVPAAPGHATVLYFHGNAGSLQHRAGRLAAFANAGYGVLMPEYRGYGGNEGTPSERAFLADADSAVAFLQQEGVRAERIVVCGESLGTGVATHIAATNAVAALVLEAPFTSIAAIASQRFGFLPINLMLKDRFDSLSRIKNVRAPVLILQGDKDPIVPAALGQELFKAASEPKTLWTAPGGGHNNLDMYGAEKVTLDFLRQHVPSK
jgi:fermentation-respiration switch protein FrsA (DUF1100 family)